MTRTTFVLLLLCIGTALTSSADAATLTTLVVSKTKPVGCSNPTAAAGSRLCTITQRT